MRETFSASKTVEAMLLLARHLARPTMHELLKLLYFADKLHLSRYGFIASGDTYGAMEYGPVGSGTFNLLKAARGERSRWIPPSYVSLVKDSLLVEQASPNEVYALRDPNQEALSPSEVECLLEAVATYGNMEFRDRTELSHDSAWRAAWSRARAADRGNEPILPTEIAGTLENANEVISFLRS